MMGSENETNKKKIGELKKNNTYKNYNNKNNSIIIFNMIKYIKDDMILEK